MGTGLAMLALVTVIVLTLGPLPQPDFHGSMQPVPHATAYAILTAVLLSRAHRGSTRPSWRSMALVAFAVVTLGAALELAQGLVGRDAELRDVAADAIGVALGMGLWTATRVARRSAD